MAGDESSIKIKCILEDVFSRNYIRPQTSQVREEEYDKGWGGHRNEEIYAFVSEHLEKVVI